MVALECDLEETKCNSVIGTFLGNSRSGRTGRLIQEQAVVGPTVVGFFRLDLPPVPELVYGRIFLLRAASFQTSFDFNPVCLSRVQRILPHLNNQSR